VKHCNESIVLRGFSAVVEEEPAVTYTPVLRVCSFSFSSNKGN